MKEAEHAQSGFYVVSARGIAPPGREGRLLAPGSGRVHGGAEGSVAYRPPAADDHAVRLRLSDWLLRPTTRRGGSYFVASSPAPPSPRIRLAQHGSRYRPSAVRRLHRHTGLMAQWTEPVAGAWTPTSALARAVDSGGIPYDPDQDIIYSKMYPVQRQLGYAYGYDAAALLMGAVIDCEPIFFDYGGKTWMIELWKGQYGLETGCEIGVYYRATGSTRRSTHCRRDSRKAAGRYQPDSQPSSSIASTTTIGCSCRRRSTATARSCSPGARRSTGG